MLCTPFGLIKENLQPYNFIEVEGGSSPVVDSTEFMAWPESSLYGMCSHFYCENID